MNTKNLEEISVDSLHYFDPDLQHRDGVLLCRSCQICLLGIDAELPEMLPQQVCASCGKEQPKDYLYSLNGALKAVSAAIESCETDDQVKYAHSKIHTTLTSQVRRYWGDEGMRWMKYRRKTYALLPAAETACQNGDVSWAITRDGTPVGQCWAPIDATWPHLKRSARRALYAIEHPDVLPN